ncbi:DUF427 domain-containing protein [Streptomyces sp. Ag109_G2-15]|uniref:DUF427 domain-containing protein n=1 Tax=Streptomyces sp. Ag109_G2-15 TaxID=1938850 RepID=UPI000BE41B3C|nr:DUF427 domain-containing protein [Streptomyces sp. Ag109_G2-15]
MSLWERVSGNVTVVDSRHPGLVWSYPDPLPAVGPIKGLLAFSHEEVGITVDGERLERPVTHFSRTLS